MAAGFTTHEIWSLTCISLLLTAYVCLLTCNLYRNLRLSGRGSLTVVVNRWCSSLRQRIASACAREREDAEDAGLERHVAERVADQAIVDLRRLVAYLVFFLAVSVTLSLLNIIRGAPRWNKVEDDVVGISGFAIFLLINTFPRVINTRSILFWYSFFMGFVIGRLWPIWTPADLFHRSIGNWVLRHLISAAIKKPLAVGCWQVVYFVCSCYRFIDLSREVESDITVSQHILFELVLMMIVTVFTYQATASSRDKVRSDAKSTMLKGERSAMARILELMCDVVIELDASFEIKRGADKFAALVSLGASSKKGMGLQEYMPVEEDKVHFQRCLSSCTGNDGCLLATEPGVLHVKLRDALGNHLNVELFYAQVEHLNERGFFVGIREQTDNRIPDLHGFDSNSAEKSSKRKALLQLKGTPPVAIGRALASEEDKDSSASPGSNSHFSAIPVLQPTDHKGLVLSLCQTFKSWVLDDAETFCCPYHSSIDAAKTSLDIMEGYTCAPSFGEPEGPTCQCLSCGILQEEAEPRRPRVSAGPAIRRRQVCSACGSKKLRLFFPKENLESTTAAAAEARAPARSSLVEL